jgi:hypothetical protein
MALGVGIVLATGLAGRVLLADQAKDSEPTTKVIKRHVKTIEDSTGTTLGSGSGRSSLTSRGGSNSNRKYSERSFSSSAYREKAGEDLRRKKEQEKVAQSTTNAPAVEAAGVAPAVEPAIPVK